MKLPYKYRVGLLGTPFKVFGMVTVRNRFAVQILLQQITQVGESRLGLGGSQPGIPSARNPPVLGIGVTSDMAR